MEPQLEGCGKTPRPMIFPTSPWLQWSRNLRVAESAPLSAGLELVASFNGAAT